MGNKDFRSNRSVETTLSDTGNNRRNKEERFPQLDGYFVHSGYKFNNIKMGEVVKAFLNTIGFTVYLLGILTNMNNIISIALGAVGFGYGIFKILYAWEVWRMKRIDRKEREDGYNDKNNY